MNILENSSPAGKADDFALFSSLRYDPQLLESADNTVLGPDATTPCPFYMLRYHRDRLQAASRHFGWHKLTARLSGAEGLIRLEENLDVKVQKHQQDSNESQPLKVRLDLLRL